MLHAGLDLSRRRLDVCLLSGGGEPVAEFATHMLTRNQPGPCRNRTYNLEVAGRFAAGPRRKRRLAGRWTSARAERRHARWSRIPTWPSRRVPTISRRAILHFDYPDPMRQVRHAQQSNGSRTPSLT